MKLQSFRQATGSIASAFQDSLKRFPATVGFLFALSAFFMFVTEDCWNGETRVLSTTGYFLSVGALLSFTLHLWGEDNLRTLRKTAVWVVAFALLVADCIFIYRSIGASAHASTELVVSHIAMLFALSISLFFLPFLREKNDIASWNFALNMIVSAVVIFFICLLLFGGISLLLYSLHQIFELHIAGECYAHLFNLCCLLLCSMLFLHRVPQGEKKHDRTPLTSGFFNSILLYLFLPLTGGYLTVLYVYAARILLRWELPSGWVSWLVIVLMTISIGIQIGLYPIRIKEKRRLEEQVSRWLPLLTLPLLLLMTIGIFRRFNDYGVTVHRLYLATLNAWFYFVCIGLIIGKARRIHWIPFSFAALFLLTSSLPVNYISITRSHLIRKTEKEIHASCPYPLPLSETNYFAWLKTLPREKAVEINSRCRYVDNWFGNDKLKSLIAKDVSFYNEFYYSRYNDTIEIYEEQLSDTVAVASRVESSLYHRIYTDTPITLPEGYTWFAPVNKQSLTITEEEYKKGVLSIPFTSELPGCKADTLYFDLDTLRALDRQNKMSPTHIRCKSGKFFFILSSFHLYGLSEKTEITFDFEGYIFSK